MSDAPTSHPPSGATANVLDLARGLRPQSFGSTSSKSIDDPLVEPLWTGIRVIAAAGGGAGALLEDGSVVSGHADVADALGRTAASTADAVILDGYLTKQASTDDAGVYTGVELTPSTGEFLTQTFIGKRRNRSEEMLQEREAEHAARTFEPNDVVALVAVDLLWLDGTWLLDVPLLERRRLLEAVVPGGELIRPGMYVRPPIDAWIGSWRAQGFAGMTFKAANSRYRPGEIATDWATASMPRR
ncbi:MAG TPA: hypothetical protein VIH00_03620 [Candidatus Limnocylindrales bacterium]